MSYMSDSRSDRRDAHTIRFQPSQLSAVLLRNFTNVLSQFPALSAIATPASLGESLSAIDALRVAQMPSSHCLDFAVMSSLEVGFTAPGGDASLSLLPSLLHASFSSRPVQSRAVASVDLLRNVSAPAVVAAPPGVSAPGVPAAPTSAPAAGHSRQLKIYFASPQMMSLDAQLSSLAAAGESGIVPFIDSVTREKSIPLLRILLGVTSSMPTELDGLCSILTLRAHLVKYWFSVLFASLVDPVSLVPSIPSDVAKCKDEWLAGDGVLFAQHVLEHARDGIDWWGLHAFA